jgi:hypothetical protein
MRSDDLDKIKCLMVKYEMSDSQSRRLVSYIHRYFQTWQHFDEWFYRKNPHINVGMTKSPAQYLMDGHCEYLINFFGMVLDETR